MRFIYVSHALSIKAINRFSNITLVENSMQLWYHRIFKRMYLKFIVHLELHVDKLRLFKSNSFILYKLYLGCNLRLQAERFERAGSGTLLPPSGPSCVKVVLSKHGQLKRNWIGKGNIWQMVWTGETPFPPPLLERMFLALNSHWWNKVLTELPGISLWEQFFLCVIRGISRALTNGKCLLGEHGLPPDL